MWQAIVHDYLGKVLATDYDGVYLDIVDTYQYWRPREPGVATADEMVAFVEDIATYARVTRNHPDFQDFVQTVSGIGKEDLFYDSNRRQPADEVRWSVKQLDRFKAAGRPVFVTDYITHRDRIDAFYRKALSHGYVPYATRRDLDVLTINRGHAPD